ncbi:MAG: stage III sporulation protein AE [Oscillospiraceae bacterium]|nr:stage III sporulation protein AE [Oscillospiraceae bacterium]
MKWVRLAVVLILVLAATVGRADAAALPGDLTEQVNVAALEEAAPEELKGLDVFSFTSLEDVTARLKEHLRTGLSDALGGAVSGALRLLLVVLFCALCQSVAVAGGVRVIHLAGAAGVSLVALADLHIMIGLGRETIAALSDFTTALFPALTAASVLGGGAVSAPARQTVTLFCSTLLIRVISQVLLPLTYGYAALCVASAVVGRGRLNALARLLRWGVVTVLTVILMGYVAYLTVSGAVASTADASAVRAARFAISGMVPIVGGILSDATGALLGGASVLRNAVGLFGMLGVLTCCALPFLRLGAQFLLYKLVAALSAILSDSPVAALVQELGNVFALMMAMTGSCALVTLLSLVSAVSAVTP